jgi:hypothetical protein
MRYLFTVFLLQIMAGCNTDKAERNYRKYYHDNGILMKEGYFNADLKPVDTLKTYTIDGKLQWVEIYDENGKLNGESLLFYPNGEIEQRKYFSHNILHGPLYTYFPNGKIKTRGQMRNGILQGDRFYFYEDGSYQSYNFLDFYGRNAIVHEFDSATKTRTKQTGDYIVIDSIVYRGDSIYLDFLLSHPPFSRNEIVIKELESEETVSTIVVQDSADLFRLKFLKKPLVSSILLEVSQYDSIDRKKSEFNNRYNLRDN